MLSNGQDSISSYFLINTIFYCTKIIKNYSVLFYCYHIFQKNNITSYWQLFKLTSTFKKPIIISFNYKNFKIKNKLKNNELNARLWRIYSKNKIISLFYKYNNIIIQGHTFSDLIETFFIFFKRYKILKNIYFTKAQYKSKKINNKFSSNLIKFPKKLKKVDTIYFKIKKPNTFYKEIQSYKNHKVFYKHLYQIYKTERPLFLKNLKRKDISTLIFKTLLPFIYDLSNIKILYIRNKIRFYYIIIIKNLIKNAKNQI